MSPEEKIEIITEIIAMWNSITTELAEKRKFERKLFIAKDDQLVAIYFHYQSEIKKRGIKRIPCISPKLYLKMKRILKEKPKSGKMLKNEVIPELLQITKNDLNEEMTLEGDILFLDIEKLANLRTEKQEEILAIIWYYQLLNESQDKLAKGNNMSSVAVKINDYFSFHSDFYRLLCNKGIESWQNKSKEEQYYDLIALLSDVLNPYAIRSRK